MRLVVTPLLVFLLIGMGAQAQQHVAGVSGYGMKAGVGWASMGTNDETFNTGTTGGITAGVFVTYTLSPKLALQPELLYASKGSSTDNLFFASGFDCSYLEVPILLRYNLTQTGKLKPVLYAGPAVGVLLSGELFSDWFIIGRDGSDVSDGMNSVDFSLVVGGELGLPSSRRFNFFVDLRYSLGLTNTVDPAKWNDGRTIIDEGDWGIFHWTDYDRPILPSDAYARNRVFSIMFGIRFK